MTLIEFGLLATVSVSGLSGPQKFTVWPTLTVQHYPFKNYCLYFKQKTSARTMPTKWNTWNPVTMKWVSEVGCSVPFDGGFWDIYFQHQSHHPVRGLLRVTDSFDALGVTWRKLF